MKKFDATEAAMDLVRLERKRQDERWGEQNHAPGKWLMILTEELGEACQADLEGMTTDADEEWVQVAAVALQIVECRLRQKADRHKEGCE